LTNLTFLKQYKRVLKNDGFVHLKTDSEFMHGYTLGILNGLSENIEYSNHDIYNREGSPDEVTSIKTFYEDIYLREDKAITYVRFKLNSGWI
jgi:tRNA (guanine-N7-)-methyltransferase